MLSEPCGAGGRRVPIARGQGHLSDRDRRHPRNTVIRPLLYSSERDIVAYSVLLDFPIIPCNLCGSQENLWRQQVKEMLDDVEKRAPQVRESMLAALKNVRSSHLLGSS